MSAYSVALLGTVGTWVAGLSAAAIALVQLYRSGFQPRVIAYHDSSDRIVVRVINNAGGAGMIEDLSFLSPGHGPNTPELFYRWEIAGRIVSSQTPLPFALPGYSTAQLVVKLRAPASQLPGIRARVKYGNDRKSRCTKIEDIEGTIFGSTQIPGIANLPTPRKRANKRRDPRGQLPY